ncbi:hypothetical protein [Comamonas endophytica]|uniref:Uncharacterized protein n=1 Tax=Comamonas endophytica TaxID=2949090 RepID=A0ABY6GBV6_9BURK|nr:MULTISPECIES: hypothetical protein [unclassified Acidovorax]MCD2512067.1 hypothetical protein [Acidovorax sp. D4N7]UYG51847.1 hypothetical protein M9799_00885 [Acidovorax sp. 5MLIR]
MNLLTRTALLASSLLAPIALASNVALEESFKAFSHCDERFFLSLHRNSAAWSKHVPLDSLKDVSWIPVQDRAYGQSASVPLRHTPQVAGVKLLAYFDKSVDLDVLGNYLFWGFVVEGSPDEVAGKLRPLIHRSEHLLPVSGLHARGEVRKGAQWEVVAAPPGDAPGRTRLERIFILEPDEGSQGKRTRVTCSLQGAVDAEVLAEFRPDIAAADHPEGFEQ